MNDLDHATQGYSLTPNRPGAFESGPFHHNSKTPSSSILPSSHGLLDFAASFLDRSAESHPQFLSSALQGGLAQPVRTSASASTLYNDVSAPLRRTAEDGLDTRTGHNPCTSMIRASTRALWHFEDQSEWAAFDCDGTFLGPDEQDGPGASEVNPQLQLQLQLRNHVLRQHLQLQHHAQAYGHLSTSTLLAEPAFAHPAEAPPRRRAAQHEESRHSRAPPSKRPRTALEEGAAPTGGPHCDQVSCSDEDTNEGSSGNRFRRYQAEQWSDKFEELLLYRREHGHCCVPHTYVKDGSGLARWVKRQRYQYKIWLEGDPGSTMTPERVRVLEEAGFVWDSHGAAWELRFVELAQYRESTGHCNVPTGYRPNPQLGTWIKCQRRQYKTYWDDDRRKRKTCLSVDRINRLEALGFEWELRSRPKNS